MHILARVFACRGLCGWTDEAARWMDAMGFPLTLATFSRLYESCALLGGTLMPHTLYLGSGIVQPRLRAFDSKLSSQPTDPPSSESSSLASYRPSLTAIQSCLSYSIAELCTTLFLISTFVNSAILIVAAAFLADDSAAAGDAVSVLPVRAVQD